MHFLLNFQNEGIVVGLVGHCELAVIVKTSSCYLVFSILIAKIV